ncbi:MAG: hypothetical protein Q9166_005727 [cf. Caloplaca sp. 2 TL-2023]
MTPPTATRRSSRKRSAGTRAFADRDIIDSSPSRGAKRKKPTATTARPRRRPQTPESEAADDNDSDEEVSSNAEAQTVADKVVPLLEVAKAPVMAAAQFSNAKAEAAHKVEAYAKLCGRHWTYYVKTLNVVIGRPPDATSRHSSSLDAESSPGARDDSPQVDIDLGPSKTVSRFHAELVYRLDDTSWHFEVKGRNGAKLNDRSLNRGQDCIVGCGDVLEIAGTQMMFVTAEGRANIHWTFLDKMHMALNDDEPTQTNSHPHAHPVRSYAPARPSPQSRTTAAAVTPTRSNGRTTIAPAPPNFVRAVTPSRSPKKQQRTSSAIKQSPTFKRGYVIESSEQIDFTSDATKDLKPTIPYSVMITQAILSTPDQQMALNKIYEFIMRNFAYYRHLKTNWQNSIRHNLSLHTGFEKVPRGPNEPGKGMNWRLVEAKRPEMIQAVAKHMKKSNARPPSVPTSPALMCDDPVKPQCAPASTQQHSSETNGVFKTSPPAAPSPPLNAYPIAQESYTPTRGSRNTALASHNHSQNLPTLSDDLSPLPIRRNNLRAGVTDSSPVLPSSFFDGPMMTPAPRQYNLNIPQPNTIKLPTSHMVYSSPAPFWKQPVDSVLGSTPMRFPEVSPLKVNNNDVFQSSSPPSAAMANGGNESPTKGRGVSKFTNSTSTATADGRRMDEGEEEEEGAIDLVKYVSSKFAMHWVYVAANSSIEEDSNLSVRIITN